MLHRAQATIDRPQSWRDYVVPQRWDAFTDDDHAVWDLLFARQVELLGTRVVTPFLDGIDLLRLSHPGVPDLGELNAILDGAIAEAFAADGPALVDVHVSPLAKVFPMVPSGKGPDGIMVGPASGRLGGGGTPA